MTSPITPPDELVQQWRLDWVCVPDATQGALGLQRYIATAAAQWGWDQRGEANEAELQQAADQELDACCEVLNKSPYGASLAVNGVIEQLRAARRPQPLSLNEVALQMLGTIERDAHYIPEITDTIRRALEAHQ